MMKIKIVNLKGVKRVIHGKLLDDLDIDYTQNLDSLKADIELALTTWIRMNKLTLIGSLKTISVKNVVVHQGSSHLDIVEDGVGSLNWLTVLDNRIF
ncbi:hypothetical protein [Acinetobacter baumannii]|uniref:hypothetical protein n=1 Tax=Acinetobacter baumannii TaxID=470 RepID=UPI0027412E46|nr:hypothetical protein [Acinetobacter baumannii]MDP7849478.1 hypothetical protein [Acinetobacter baumannii]